jgi:hypothetical protein
MLVFTFLHLSYLFPYNKCANLLLNPPDLHVDLTYSMVNAFKKIMDKGWVSVRSVSIGPFSPTKMHHSMSTV